MPYDLSADAMKGFEGLSPEMLAKIMGNKGTLGGSPENNIISTLQQLMGPYFNAGKSVLPDLQTQFGQLTNDPGALFEKFSQGYKPSAGYQLKQREGQNAALNAAAAGGMGGSPEHQEYAGRISEGIADEDFMKYMEHILGMYGTGLQGEEGFSKMGFEAGRGMGEDIASYLAQQQMMNFLKKQSKSKQHNDLMGSILGTIGTIGGAYAGGSFGGPAGAMAGAKGGNYFGQGISKF